MNDVADASRFFQDRNIEVAEECHRDGSGDGRGGHDEVVRVAFGLSQSGSLANAEFVLFIDDDESEVLEGCRPGDDCLCSDDDVG